MKTKLFLALGLLCLSLLINTATPKEAWACSGDDCGCNITFSECMSCCDGLTGDAYIACTAACRQEYRNCAIACCSW